MAVHPDRAGAVAVAEHAAVHLGAELAHFRALSLGRQPPGRVVERLDLLRDGEVLIGHGAVGDLGVNERHMQRAMTEQGGDRLQRHAAVDRLGGQRVPEPVRRNPADSGGFGGLGHRGVHPRFRDLPPLLNEDQLGAQPLRPLGQPLAEQFLKLRVQRDITVGVQLADRHVQPVCGTDLHDRVGGERQVLALPQAGPGQELHGQPHERVLISAGGLQQLGRRCVIEEPGQRLVGDREVRGQHRHPGGGVGDVPFDQPGEEAAQRAEPVLDRVPVQRAAAAGRPLRQPELVFLDVAPAQVGDAPGGRIAFGGKAGELPQRGLDVVHPARTKRRSQLRQVVLHGGAHDRRHRRPRRSAGTGLGPAALAGSSSVTPA